MASLKDELETGGGGGDLGIDMDSLKAASPRQTSPFAAMCERVLREADVPITADTRQLASIVCGQEGVSGLPFVQDGTYEKTRVAGDGSRIVDTIDALEEQADVLAKRADERIDSPMVWWPTAKKLAVTALRLRVEEHLFEYEPPVSQEERSRRVKAALAA